MPFPQRFSGTEDGDGTVGTFTLSIAELPNGGLAGTWQYHGTYNGLGTSGVIAISGNVTGVEAPTGNFWRLRLTSGDDQFEGDPGSTLIFYNGVYELNAHFNFGIPTDHGTALFLLSANNMYGTQVVPPVISIDRYTARVEESDGISIVLKRSGADLGAPSTVVLFSEDGAARSDGTNPDFESFRRVVTFAPFHPTVTIELPNVIVNDQIREVNENFGIFLTDPTNGTVGFDRGNITILDDDGGGAINGTSGGDDLLGGGGKDTMDGMAGNDRLDGQGGDDDLYGGPGNDSMDGSSGRDFVAGEEGNDSLRGGRGDDDLLGGDGLDVLRGDEGDDNLAGGAGNDTLTGGEGDDFVAGGSGDDLITWSPGDGDDEIVGGAGSDIVVFKLTPGVVNTVNVTRNPDFSVSVKGIVDGGVVDITLDGVEAVRFDGRDLDDRFTFGDLSGTDLSNHTVYVNAGGGNDRISGPLINKRLVASGGAGNDTIVSGTGHDSLDGGSGSDRLAGGRGNDTYVVGAGDVVIERAGEGVDTLQSSISSTLAPTLEKLVLIGSAHINGAGNATANVLTGNNGRNILDGRGGADAVNGLGGNDILIWGAPDTLNGGAGSDTLRVAGGGVTLDLGGVPAGKIQSIEAINIAGAGANVLELSASDVTRISETDILRVVAGADDRVLASGGWTQIGSITDGGRTYAQYTLDGATLQVSIGADRSGINVRSIFANAVGGSAGGRIAGVSIYDNFGAAVSGAGDINGDGLDDLLLGAYWAGEGSAPEGAAYVVFGRSQPLSSALNLGALNGSDGFTMPGPSQRFFQLQAVDDLGDINGDGLDDLVVSAPYAESFSVGGTSGGFGARHYGGVSYVVFGSESPFSPLLSVTVLNGDTGFKITSAAHKRAGRSLGGGDVNGDGFNDVLIGAPDSNAAFVVFGGNETVSSSMTLSDLDGTNGFKMNAPNGDFGASLEAQLDVNGDGIDDIVIGAPYSGVYVFFGSSSGFSQTVHVSTLNGSNGFNIGGESGSYAGGSVSGAGDVNGDGIEDILIGAPRLSFGNSSPGAAYVVFGAQSGFPASVQLSSMDEAVGFRISGVFALDRAGWSVSAAGDVNGDGIDDLVIGAPASISNTGVGEGRAYIVYGRTSGFGSAIDLSALDGTDGFMITAGSSNSVLGISVSAAGDLNGDGFADLVIGAPQDGLTQHGRQQTGAAYLVYGGNFTGEVTHLGTAGANSLVGNSAANIFVAGRGNDIMDGNGGADVFRGGAGNDRFVIGSAAFADADGGRGNDTLALEGSIALDLTRIGNARLTGIEAIDLANGVANVLTLDLREVLNLSDTSNRVTVNGESGDRVSVSGGTWSAPVLQNGYYVYTSGAAELRIDADILVAMP